MESIERLLKQGDKGRKIVEEYIYGKDSKWVRKNFGDPIAKFYSGYPAPALDAPEEKIEEWKEAQTAEVWNYKMLEIYFNIKRRVRGIIILDYFEWYRYREYPGFKRELMEALWKAENKNSNP
ncbi:MAG: hypothetical protein E3J72_03875 [Planctomycetota bacterium]|nr:MAG: hypothetical protein E3J72_03875 [Planctomycetota bacterium]